MRIKKLYRCNCGWSGNSLCSWRKHRRFNKWHNDHSTFRILTLVATQKIPAPQPNNTSTFDPVSPTPSPSDDRVVHSHPRTTPETPLIAPTDGEIDAYLTYLSQFANVEVKSYGRMRHVELDHISIAAARTPLVALKRATRQILHRGIANLVLYDDKRHNISLLFAGKMENPLALTRNTRVALKRIEILKDYGTVEYSLQHGWCQIYLDRRQIAESRGPTSALRKALEVLRNEDDKKLIDDINGDGEPTDNETSEAG